MRIHRLALLALLAGIVGCPAETDDDTAEEIGPLNDPSGFEGLIVDEGYQLRWADGNEVEVSHELQRRLPDQDDFQPLAAVEPGSTSHLDEDFDADAPPLYRVRATQGERVSEWAELDASVPYWTYMRLIGYDSLWGDEGPTRQELVSWHLTYDMTEKAADAPNIEFLLLGDWYGDEGSIYAHTGPDGAEFVELDELNTGDVATYEAFFDWAVANHPGQHYVVSYWSHGGGSAMARGSRDIGYDDTDDDSLDPEEMGASLRYLAGLAGDQVDVFSVCACLTQMVENAYALRDAVRFFVAGESVVGCGCDVLDVFWDDPDQTPRQIADATVGAHGSEMYPNDVVFASVDVSRALRMADEFDALAISLEEYALAGEEYADELREAADAAQNMNYVSYPNAYGEYLDVVHLCEQLEQLDGGTAAARAQSVREFVTDELLTSVMLQNDLSGLYEDAHGISIFHPTPSSDWFDAESYGALSFCQDTYWDEYLGVLY